MRKATREECEANLPEQEEEQEEDGSDSDRHDHHQVLARPLHVLELASPLVVVTGRQFHILFHTTPQLGYESPQIAISNVHPDVHPTPGHLAFDLGQSLSHLDARQAPNGDSLAVGRLHEDALDGAHAVPQPLRVTHHGLEAALTLVDIGRNDARNRGLHHVVHIADIEAVPCNRLPVDAGVQVVLASYAIDLDVSRPCNRAGYGAPPRWPSG